MFVARITIKSTSRHREMRPKKVFQYLSWTTLLLSAALLAFHASTLTDYFDHPSSDLLFNSKNKSSLTNNSYFNNKLHSTHVPETIQRKELREDEYFQIRKVKVNPIDESVLVENRLLCNQNDGVAYLLVVVPSKPSDFNVRNVIRETIGSYVSGDFAKQLRREHNATMKLLFVVGNGPNQTTDDIIQKENESHRDVLQANFTDTYRNLTKKMLIALKWIAAYCATVNYVIKVDTDVFVNIPVLIPILKSQTMKPNGTIIGHIYGSGVVSRNGTWKVTKEEYPFKQYPSYASGNAYVISGHILQRLIHAAEHIPSMPIEDAYITGIMAKVIGAKRVHVSGFSQWLNKQPTPCLFFKRNKVTGTKVTNQLWQELWSVQNDYHTKCE